MLAKPLGLRADPVGLVQDDELPRETRSPAPQVLVVEQGITVLLGIRDPHDRVDARKELVNARAMLWRRRIDVGEVQDRDVRERIVAVTRILAHVEPPEERRA